MSNFSLIAQCTNPICNFRGPLVNDEKDTLYKCPKCNFPVNIQRLQRETPEINPRLEKKSRPILHVLLDNIRSAYNVGAIFRTADGAGVEKIYTCGITPTPEHPRIKKTALGAEYAVDWEYSSNALETIKVLHKQGYIIAALEIGSQSVPIFNTDFPEIRKNNVLVIGNELSGIDPEILPFCSHQIWIPMTGYKRSLNVACAFSIAIYILQFSLKPSEREA